MTEPSQASFAQAVECHRRGDLGEAARRYRAVLHEDPQHVQALLLLARLSHDEGRHDEALALAGGALQIEPGSFEALMQQGLAQRALGRTVQAVASYETALALRPDATAALYNLGNALAALDRLGEALHCFDRVLALDPADAAAFNNRGVVLRDLARETEALASFDAALALRPGYPEALNNRGNVLQALGRHAEALASHDRALGERPVYAEALNNRGNALLALERAGEALESYKRALAARPGYVEALGNCGKALQALGRYEEALRAYEEVRRLRPADANGLNSLGNAMHALGRYQEALQCHEDALRLEPDSIEALNNRGNMLQALQRPEEALASYARALALNPEDAEARWNQALTRLSVGDYERGWKDYEWRWRNPALGMAAHETQRPLWLGAEDISGKTVLLHSEQGYGDAIQMVRFAPLVAARGARVVLACAERLRALFETVQGVASVFVPEQDAPAFDYHVPLMSLPLAFRTTLENLPSQVPYFHASQDKAAAWKKRLAQLEPGLKVGLAWSGNPSFGAARIKACPAELLDALLSVPGCSWVSLQTGDAAAEAVCLAGGNGFAIEAGGELADFDDTAALVSALDLVVSIDTAVAHLTGALGKPVWIMLPYAADWRWLREREDSPWYPTARLYRQPRPGDWESVVASLAADLSLRGKGNG